MVVVYEVKKLKFGEINYMNKWNFEFFISWVTHPDHPDHPDLPNLISGISFVHMVHPFVRSNLQLESDTIAKAAIDVSDKSSGVHDETTKIH